MSSAPRSLSPRGFTLLEVMVALAILAMGLVAVSDVVGGALRNHAGAKQLDVATLLARGKIAALEDKYDEEGFRVDDQEDEGSFEDQGHPEVRWKAVVKKPSVDLGGTNLCDRLLGEGGIEALIGSQTKPKDGGPQTVSPLDAIIGPMVKAQCASMGETVKKGLRELRLTVSWPDGTAIRSFTVVEHLVVLTPAQGKP